MKKLRFGFMSTLTTVGLVAAFTACSSSDSPAEPITDNDAGTLKITNTTRGVELGEGGMDLYKEDVLKVEFVPNEKYKKYKFETVIKVNGVSLGQDGRYTVKQGGTSYAFSVTARYEAGEINLSANKTVTVQQEYNVTVPYVLYMTPDLRELINVKATYKTEAGNVEALDAERLIASNDIKEKYGDVYTYEDGGFTYYTFNKGEAESYDNHTGPDSVETVPMLLIKQPYYRMGIATEVTITYESKNRELVKDEYNIGRKFDRKRALFNLPTEGGTDKNWRYTIPLFTGEKMSKEQVQRYLNDLKNVQDKISFKIDKDGNIPEK